LRKKFGENVAKNIEKVTKITEKIPLICVLHVDIFEKPVKGHGGFSNWFYQSISWEFNY